MASYKIVLDADETDLDRTIDRAADKLDKLSDKAQTIDLGGGSSSRSGGTSRGGLSDPWSRHEDALVDLSAARSMGLSRDQIRPYELAAARARLAEERADRDVSGETRMERMARAQMFSRLTTSGGFNVGLRLSEMLGPEALGVGAAIYGGAQIFNAGQASSHDLGNAYYAGGGGAAGTAGLGSVGRFLGRDAASSANAAVAFGDALHQPTYGAGYLRSRGIVDLGGLTIDKSRNYLKAIDMIASEPDEGTAIRVARDTGLTSELWMRDLNGPERKEVLSGRSDTLDVSTRRFDAVVEKEKGDVQGWLERQWRGFRDAMVRWQGDDDNELREAMADKYGLPRARTSWRDIESYERARNITPNANEIKLGHDWRAQARAESSGDVSHSGPVSPGVRGGGIRVQAAAPVKARFQQLSENLEGYGKYVGGYY